MLMSVVETGQMSAAGTGQMSAVEGRQMSNITPTGTLDREFALKGVRAWLACDYFIPGGASQRGGWSGSGVPCRTLSDLIRGQAKLLENSAKSCKNFQNQSKSRC